MKVSNSEVLKQEKNAVSRIPRVPKLRKLSVTLKRVRWQLDLIKMNVPINLVLIRFA